MVTLNEAVNRHADDLARELCRMDNAVCEMYATLRESGKPLSLPKLVEARMEVLLREIAEIRLRVIAIERRLRGSD